MLNLNKMKPSTYFTILALIINVSLKSQVIHKKGEIIDVRDGKVYQTIMIDSTIWLAENMKFKTANCHLNLKEINGIDLDGYYYPYEETNQVCPNNFRIPTIEEWEKYLDMILGERNVSYNIFTSEDFKNNSRYQVASGYSFTDIDFKFIMNPNPLNFRPSGWVQGNKFKLIKEGLTFWLRNGQKIDSTWHTHAYNHKLINHSHDHHIKDKPRKTRKFVVRCVKE